MTTRTPSLGQAESVRTGVVRILDQLVDHALTRSPQSPPDPHPPRLALKRLRALVRAVGPALPAEGLAAVDAALQGAAHQLAPFREQMVARETLQALGSAARSPGGPPPRAAGDVAGLESALRAAEVTMDSARRSLQEMLWDGRGWKLLGPGIAQTYRQAHRRHRSAVEAGTEEAFHRWRVRVKQLGYQLEWVQDADEARFRELGAQLRKLGQLLGSKHDFDVLAAGLPERSADAVASATRENARQESQKLQSACTALGARIFRVRPRDFRRALRRRWRRWRRGA